MFTFGTLARNTLWTIFGQGIRILVQVAYFVLGGSSSRIGSVRGLGKWKPADQERRAGCEEFPHVLGSGADHHLRKRNRVDRPGFVACLVDIAHFRLTIRRVLGRHLRFAVRAIIRDRRAVVSSSAPAGQYGGPLGAAICW